MAKKSGYDLSRRWFDFAFETKEAKTTHTAIFMWIVELNNRLGWKDEFGLPTGETMDGLSIGNKNTYSSAINDLVNWKFIEIVRDSKNQYESRVVRICRDESEPALIRPLDRALLRHSIGHRSGTASGIDPTTAPGTVPIDKQQTKNQKPKTNKPTSPPKVGDPLTKDFVDRYEKFLLTNANVGENVTASGRTALKKIIAYLRGEVKKKHGDSPEVETKTVEAWEYILNNFSKWDSFQQKNLNLEQINKNIVNIISTIRNTKTNGSGSKNKFDTRAVAEEILSYYSERGPESGSTNKPPA